MGAQTVRHGRRFPGAGTPDAPARSRNQDVRGWLKKRPIAGGPRKFPDLDKRGFELSERTVVTNGHFRVLLTADVVGDTWDYSLELARGLSRLGVETVLAIIGPPSSEEQRKAAAAVPSLKLIETGLALDSPAEDDVALAKAGQGIARLAKAVGADLVQLNNAALAASAGFSVPVIVTHHRCFATWWQAVNGAELPMDFAWRRRLVARGLAAADAVVTPTAAFGEMVQECYGLPRPPRTVHHGRTPLAPPRTIPRDFVFTAGRLWDEGKNLGTIDAAVAGLGIPVRAAGPLKGPNGVEVMFDNIDCLGPLGDEELGGWLSARPVFVSAALYEPAGRAVLAAASAGCPLILSDIPTFRELWDGVATFIPPRDERAFTDAISGLVGDDFERAVQGRATRERAALYTPDAMAAQMAALYRGLLPSVRGPVLAAARAA
ncbi:MAG: glycosyltransferase [Alphaproteobacteria bacterium]|nr:glycosyltransferase [Alphaproteobacteria bacterium]